MDELTERAQRAVRVFKSMQFGLTSYARALSGNKRVSVVPTEGQVSTDGHKIFIRPPIALGDGTKHVRGDCDKRDENLQLICQACAIREEVLVNVYHEIGHIAFDSFAKTSERDKKLAFEKAANSSKWGTYAQFKMKYTALPQQTDSYLGLARLINPFLFGIIQALDDVRVDSSMFRARPGVKTMLTASSWALFNEGTERLDGTRSSWRDAPLNAQAAVACYLAGVGYTGWQEWLHPTIGDAFADPELDSLMTQARESKTVSEVFNLAFPVLDALRKYGFFKTPEEEEQDEQDSNATGEPVDEQQRSNEGLDGERGEETPDQSSEEEAGEAGADREEGLGTDEVRGSESSDSTEEDGDNESAGESGEGDEVLDGEEGSSDSDPVSGSAESEGAADSGAEASGTGEEGSESEVPPTESNEAGGSDQDDSEYTDERDASGGSDTGGQATSSDVDDDSEAEGQSTGSTGSDQDSSSTEPDAEASGSSSDEAAESDGRSSEDSGPEDSEQLEPVDTGADQGDGGLELPEYGSADDAEQMLCQVHEAKDASAEESYDEQQAVSVAIVQGLYFEKPSENVMGVREHHFDSPTYNSTGKRMDQAWTHDIVRAVVKKAVGVRDSSEFRIAAGIDVDLEIPESVMGPALLQTRRVFTDNAIAAHQRNMKSGRIDRKVLGRRAWNDDNRLFSKKRLPGKRSYAVVIGIDISGSTFGVNLALAKRAAYAQAELCDRAGVDFAVYAHTASGAEGGRSSGRGLWLDMYQIKAFNEPWDKNRRHRLAEIGPSSENLDGHGIEYYRKRLDEMNTTDKILLYYTDGKMPAANKEEELEILQREIKTCKHKGYVLLGVGIRTDSPKRHGLDTIQVDDDEDLKAVVMHLERRLIGSGR